jgi:nitroreductase
MDLLEGLYTRRSTRHYTNQPVEREQLLEVIKAGMWAPSGLNNQPWRFVIVTNEEGPFGNGRLHREHAACGP